MLQAINQKRVTGNSIKACEVLLAYAWGRPPVAVELSGEVSVNIAARLEEARKRVLELAAANEAALTH